MTITKRDAADKIAAYLHRQITLADLVDWAEDAMMEGTFDAATAAALSTVIARLGVADVRAFGLTWGDCEDLVQQLGYKAHVEIIAD